MKQLTKLTLWRTIAGILLTVGAYAAYMRFTRGLGATTHLSDIFPWGLWIGFDFLGVGIAAAGFTIVASVHLFHLHRFEPIVRPAVLTAFVGYLLVILVLVIDLGRPENFWHPLVMWNPHSVMFEITWCVICYTTVLSLEFAPIVLEKYKITAPLKILRAISIPLMILGVLFSTLHQSSFGSLYLIVPGRLHPLWYSSLLPVMFFVSCIAAGISMIIVESFYVSRSLRNPIPFKLLSDLAKVIPVVLIVYCIMRIQDLMSEGTLSLAFSVSYQSIFFDAEMLIGFIIPMVLLMIHKVRESRRGLFISCIMVIIGFAMNRMDTAITGMEDWATHTTYFPSWMEISITLGIATLGFVAFRLVSKHFPIFGESAEHVQHEAAAAHHSLEHDLRAVSMPN